MNSYDIIRKPVITEKSMKEMANKQYTLIVNIHANKCQIKRAVEEVFGVKVADVRTANFLGKNKRVGVHAGKKANYKKAMVQLSEESKTIEFFDGI